MDERNHSSLPIENDKTTNLKSIPADPARAGSSVGFCVRSGSTENNSVRANVSGFRLEADVHEFSTSAMTANLSTPLQGINEQNSTKIKVMRSRRRVP